MLKMMILKDKYVKIIGNEGRSLCTLKRVVKRTYKKYTGGRIDGKTTLLDVAKLFSISIDKPRRKDYVVEKNGLCYSINSNKRWRI